MKLSLRQSYSVPGCRALPKACISMIFESITVKNTITKSFTNTNAEEEKMHKSYLNNKDYSIEILILPQ